MLSNGVGRGVSRVGIFIVRGERVVGCIGILGAKYEEIGRGFDVRVSKEEVTGIKEITCCGIKESKNVGAVWGFNDIGEIGEVGGIIIVMFCDVEGVPLVVERT